MPRTIPERAPLGDTVQGHVIDYAGEQFLATLDIEAQPGSVEIASGTFTIRYGVRFLGKSFLSIVPGLVVLDYGDILTGDEAWDFLLRRSNLHPRAEVVGYRSDGKDDMVFIRDLDLALPVEVLVYRDAQATTPLARPVAVISSGDTLPARLLEYLPRYASLSDWTGETAL